MRHNHYMPLFVGDYLRDTGHLTTCEHGAYLLLLMHYWSTGGLPENEDCIRRITKMNNTMWARSRDTLAALFKPGWRHTRLEKELAHAHGVSAVRAESGAKGAAAKGRKLTGATDSKTHLATELENEPKSLKTKDAQLANATIPRTEDSSVASPNGESTGDRVAEIALVRDPDGELFFRSRQVFGPQCGGMIVRLKTAYGGDIAKARAFVEQAALKGNPVEYLAKALHNSGAKPAPVSEWMLTA